MRTVRIKVTAEDIIEGEPCNCTDCPVAKAVQRATGNPGLEVADVARGTRLGVKSARWDWEVPLPERVVDFIKRYDQFAAGESADPITFDLELPDEAFAPEVSR